MTDTTSTDHYIDVAGETELSGEDATVTVRHIRTPKGERLEIDSSDDAIRIDALGLESLSWQDLDIFDEFLDEEYDRTSDEESDADDETVCEFTISNEYADVVARSVRSNDGERLIVEAPKKHFSIRIDPLGLAALAEQDMEIFSEFLETPHGPGGHAH